MKRLITINNNLLRALGVSHPVLEEIFAISERLGFSAKLTGAGAGGYNNQIKLKTDTINKLKHFDNRFRFAIILLPPTYAESDAFQQLSKELSHFETRVTTIGGPGLQLSE